MFYKKMFLKLSRNSQESPVLCEGLFFDKVAGLSL